MLAVQVVRMDGGVSSGVEFEVREGVARTATDWDNLNTATVLAKYESSMTAAQRAAQGCITTVAGVTGFSVRISATAAAVKNGAGAYPAGFALRWWYVPCGTPAAPTACPSGNALAELVTDNDPLPRNLGSCLNGATRATVEADALVYRGTAAAGGRRLR